jgi:N-acetylglutamate synthase-like GNAT family acetyltransferase
MNRPLSADPNLPKLRRARQDDFPAIRRLIWKVHINPTGLDWRHFWVAVDVQDRIVATGQLKPHRDGSIEMASIATEPAWRGRGIASLIIHTLMAEAPRPLYLVTIPPTAPFYIRFGFRTLAADEMPPNLRKEYRFASWISHIFNKGRPMMVIMAVGVEPAVPINPPDSRSS